ncbi:uncharacterized protein [Bactrocera oleae]|uniref:uncharacterized protein n=1 Tax=Bactrocera oleae TaxID=104688 RepID=UPI00387EE17C
MHRSKTADSLLPQLMLEFGTEVAIISEQYRIVQDGTWWEDITATAAIWLTESSGFKTTSSGRGNGFVWISNENITIISCYLTPSDPISEFQAKLDAIEDAAHHPNRHLIIAGDFNAKAMEWGTPTTNSRGRKILDMAARLGLIVANRGSQTTFRRPGCNDTTPDITLVSEGFANQLREWKVLEDYTGSDHQYISYLMGPDKSQATTKRRGTRKWNVSKLHSGKLLASIDKNPPKYHASSPARFIVKETLDSITEACKAAMPKIKGGHPKKAVYWWTDEIQNLRQTCLRKRRRYTRARRRGRNEMEEHKEYKAAKTELKYKTIKAKKDKWEELRNDINKNPWGLGYKIVMRKLGAKQSIPELNAAAMEHIVNTLFPTHVLGRDPPEYMQETSCTTNSK